MTPRTRGTTAAEPTPAEETQPTAPAEPAPEPEPAPEEDSSAEETEEERIGRMVDAAVARLPRNLFGFPVPRPVQLDPEDYPAPYSVQEAIQEVTRRVEAITKDKTATQGGSFKYRGIDDVFAALHPLLGEVGLVILPGRVVREQWETRATSSGGTLNVARLLIRYTLVGPDGSRLSGEAWGEGGDSGDKATQKAHSQSYKSFTLQLFSIPTEESQRDEPDATNPPSRPFTTEERERAATAYDAALNTDTLEKLVGVRHRAAALLDVPVLMADGRLVPLTLLFDARRAALEGAQQ